MEGGGGGLLNLVVKTNFNSFSTERRFASDSTIAQLKRLLEGLTGAGPGMSLRLLTIDGALVTVLSRDEMTLSEAGAASGMIIEVQDASVSVGQFEDTSKVKKFELSQEEYASRADSLLAFKQRNKMGQFGEGKSEEQLKERMKREEEEKKRLDSMEVGQRCLVTVTGQAPKTATLMYKGPTHFKGGYWLGVAYDLPLGKHDGSVDGKRYFQCQEKYGAFVKAENVAVGHYPPADSVDEL